MRQSGHDGSPIVRRSRADAACWTVRSTPPLQIDQEAVVRFCRRWDLVELALFGSVLRDDFRPGSDVDVLITLAPEAQRTLFDLARMREELGAIFGREVDLLTRRGVETSRNALRRESILASARPLYVASVDRELTHAHA